jgi:hypothetical protein
MKDGDTSGLETILRQVSEARNQWKPAFFDAEDGEPSSHF